MTGQQIIDNCHAIAQQQYPDDQLGAAKHEIELLRTKVLELTKKFTEPSSEPACAEQRLADAGVFLGHHGLRGLADASKFWDQQPYGKRLYYGDGNFDYLHLDVLRAAIEVLDGKRSTASEAPA